MPLINPEQYNTAEQNPEATGMASPPGQKPHPTEQLQHDAVMRAAGQMMYKGENLKSTMRAVEDGSVETAARITAYMMDVLVNSARGGKKGAPVKQLSDDAMLQAGEEILTRLLVMQMKMGVGDIGTQEELQEAVQAGGQIALQMYQELQDPASAQKGTTLGNQQAERIEPELATGQPVGVPNIPGGGAPPEELSPGAASPQLGVV